MGLDIQLPSSNWLSNWKRGPVESSYWLDKPDIFNHQPYSCTMQAKKWPFTDSFSLNTNRYIWHRSSHKVQHTTCHLYSIVHWVESCHQCLIHILFVCAMLQLIMIKRWFYFLSRYHMYIFYIAKLKSQLQLQLDWASLIISSLPASQPASHHPPGIGSNMTSNVNQCTQIRFTLI